MAELQMPAAEAKMIVVDDERNSYEFAFHLLPTVAEGEVLSVFEVLKTHITNTGGEIHLEEVPGRINLAYDIVKSIEGKYHKFGSAYFGWIRFTLQPEKLETLKEGFDTNESVLRYLLIKLTKAEEANPFKFHDSREADKMVEVIDEGDVLADPLLDMGGEEKRGSEDSSDKKDNAEEAVNEDK